MIKILNSRVEDTELQPNSYDALFCDPPYGLSFMNKNWDFDVPSPDTWKILFNALKPGSFGLVYSGSKNFWKMGYSLNESGFEIIDTILWLYGVGFPAGNLNISKALDKKLGLERGKKKVKSVGLMKMSNQNIDAWTLKALENGYIETDNDIPVSDIASLFDGYHTRLKPAFEPVLLIRKPTKLSYADNVLKYGNGVLNIEDCRVETKDKLARKRNSNIYTGDSLNHSKTSGNGKVYNQDISGRWPSNIVLDDIAGKLLDKQSGYSKSSVSLCGGLKTSKNSKKHKGWQRESHKDYEKYEADYNDEGGASRFFYCAKVSKKERNKGLNPGENNHPTLKPIELNTYLAKLLNLPYEDSKILIPFSGVGSEIIGAKLAGWNNITGIEMNQEYIDIAFKRLEVWT